MQFNYQNLSYDAINPDICPHCHVANIPVYKWHTLSTDNDGTVLLLSVWECANNRCKKIFIALYRKWGHAFDFSRFLGGSPKGPDWPKPIENLLSGKIDDEGNPLKSKFIPTYLQSLEAESFGLDELAGMGYRKAIEYLVKDWAIQNHPDQKEKIEQSWLGADIKDYYKGDLKEILERATWLGNDQAHYNKLFEEYDISILKELISLIMVELDRQFKMAHYIESIQKRK